jgi:RNA polymerase sigma-70 factor (ECF subfamily)
VLRITRNHEDAEDSVQDAILKAYANLPQFQRRARFSTWIGRIAINEALMRLRKHKVMKRVPLEDVFQAKESNDRSPELEQHGDDPETLYARQEVRELMLEAAGSLQPIYQTVFYLAQVRGCTIQETAKELELSVAAVKARLHRARKQLREKLNPIGGALPC